jgi:hypothetical protein
MLQNFLENICGVVVVDLVVMVDLVVICSERSYQVLL